MSEHPLLPWVWTIVLTETPEGVTTSLTISDGQHAAERYGGTPARTMADALAILAGDAASGAIWDEMSGARLDAALVAALKPSPKGPRH